MKWVCRVLFDFYICFSILLPHTHITKSPTIVLSQRNAMHLPVMNCFCFFHNGTRWFSCFYCFDPIEDPLKFHSVIPLTQTVVTPINVNNMPRGGIPANLHDSDTCQKDIERCVKYFTWLKPLSWFQTVKVAVGLSDRVMDFFFSSMPAWASPVGASPKRQGLIYGCVAYTWP